MLWQFNRVVCKEPFHWVSFVKVAQELSGAGGYTVKLVCDPSFTLPGALVEREVIEDLVINVSK